MIDNYNHIKIESKQKIYTHGKFDKNLFPSNDIIFRLFYFILEDIEQDYSLYYLCYRFLELKQARSIKSDIFK